MLTKFKNFFFLFLVMVSLSSCGDLFSDGQEQDEEDFSRFVTCSVDQDQLAEFFKKDIGVTLSCLERSLKLFIDVVEVERPGYLSHTALKRYIAKNMPDISEKTMQALAVIFEVNHLLFDDHINFMTETNVEKLIGLLIDVNQIIVKEDIFNFFNSEERVDISEHNRRKATIFNIFKRLSNRLAGEIILNDNKINIASLISRFESKEDIIEVEKCKKISTKCEKPLIDYVKALSFGKKILLGGSNKTISGTELKRLVILLPKISKIIFDFAKMLRTHRGSHEDLEVLEILKSDTRTLEQMLYYTDDSTRVLFTFDDLKNAVNIFMPEYAKYFNYRDEFKILKKIFLNNDSLDFTAMDVVNILSKLHKNLERGVFFYRTYDQNQSILNSAFSMVERLFTIFESPDEVIFKVQFERIVNNYRFFKGRRFSPIFGTEKKLNPKGVFEISLIEYIAKKVLVVYGTQDPEAVGGYSMSQEQLGELLLDFSDLLIKEKLLLKGRELTSAETITLMMSIFHAQSNGDIKIEIPEISEFAITLLTAVNFKGETFNFMSEKCIFSAEKKISYSAQCFRDNFRAFLSSPVKERVISDFVPQLSTYVNQLSDRTLNDYLSKVSTFTRACSNFKDGTEVPMKESDGLVIWSGLLVIEQTMSRFDVNNNNVLDPNEVDEAFPVFEEAVRGMISADFLKPLAETFFQYIVKYQKVPDVTGVESLKDFGKAAKDGAHFAIFYLKSKARGAIGTIKDWFKRGSSEKRAKSSASADRMTFASVLKIIADNSPAKKKFPFDCETLR